MTHIPIERYRPEVAAARRLVRRGMRGQQIQTMLLASALAALCVVAVAGAVLVTLF